MRALLALGLLLAAAPALADDVVLTREDAPIRDVTVYASQALVKREACFAAKAAGPLRLTIARLPPWIQDDSVRIRAGKGLVLLGSRIVERPVAASSDPAVAALEAQRREVEAERKAVADEKWVVEQTIAHVQAIQAAHAKEADGGAAALTAKLEWATRSLAEAVKRRRATEDRLADLEVQAKLLDERIAHLRPRPGREKDIEVELDARAAGDLRVEVEYVTPGASWTPAYDLRADADAKAIDVTYHGIVEQSTGEAWDGVRLALSTARPELGARPPDLEPWLARIQPLRGGRPFQVATSNNVTSFQGFDREEPADEVRPAEPEKRGATVAFHVPLPETIPSDGEEKRTTIGRATFPAHSQYVAAPKVAPFAYLRASVVNAFPYPMLAGEANVFFGPDFVGRAKVDLVPAGERTDVHLGVDERVKVERRTEKRFRDTTGLISTDVRERFEFRNVVKSYRAEPVVITIVDQVPVSQDDRIRIEDRTLSPEPTETVEKKGELRWTMALAPGAEESLLVGFTVRFPEKIEPEVVVK